MADILPECLIQKILSFLSFKEAAKMSILSKTWLRAWLTLPNLEITVNCRKRHTKIVDTIMERYRKGKIPIEKIKLSKYYYDSHEIFPLIDKWLDIALQNGVKCLVFRVPKFSLPIFTILAAKSLRELVLECCNLMPVSLSSGVVNCNSLRKLSLFNVTLDENMLQTLLNSCSLIVSFILKSCAGDFQKIKLDSLKVLKIQYCRIGEIDAPNLVSLEYMGYEIPELTIAIESSQLERSKVVFQEPFKLNATWFCKLRKFLSNLTSWSQVSLDFFECSEINMEDLQVDHRGSSPQVNVLNVNILWQNEECQTLLDALLWSCHPRRLDLQSKSATFTCFINRLIYMKNLSHTPSHEREPWHSPLKEAQVYKFDKTSQSWHSVELKRGDLSIKTVSEREKYFFLLYW